MTSYLPYSIFAVACCAVLAWMAATEGGAVENFYGFAETAETEINYNYPVEVQEILVLPGASVRAGEVLMRVRRAREREELADEVFRIEELRAEQRLTDAELTDRAERLRADYEDQRARLETKRAELAREARYRDELAGVFGESEPSPEGERYAPLDDEIAAIGAELERVELAYRERQRAIERERQLAAQPVSARVERLDAEAAFDAAQSEVIYEVTAPADGVVGSINAKIAEHKSSFSPLVTFYEPRATQVKAYIHEDRVLEASVGDSVRVKAIATPEIGVGGVITGLGSRIVEIPARLRRLPEYKTYGREVIVQIPAQNPFLQREKVVLEFAAQDD